MAKTKYLKVKNKAVVSSFPSFSATGSIIGMKRKYYGKHTLLVRCGSYIYKVPRNVYDKVESLNNSGVY